VNVTQGKIKRNYIKSGKLSSVSYCREGAWKAGDK